MKKISILLATVAIVAMASVAWAVPTTWTDSIDFNPDIKIPPAYSYIHNIAENGFSSLWMGGNDTISSYVLTLSLYDDNRGTRTIFGTIPDGTEVGGIWTSALDHYTYNFNLTSQDFAGSFLGALDIWADGRIGVKVTEESGLSNILGDFYLASSTLTVYGDNGSAPVPEPGTMVLLGAGLMGLAVFGKRRMNKA